MARLTRMPRRDDAERARGEMSGRAWARERTDQEIEGFPDAELKRLLDAYLSEGAGFGQLKLERRRRCQLVAERVTTEWPTLLEKWISVESPPAWRAGFVDGAIKECEDRDERSY